jgi:phenylacetate-CoA ligase
MARVFGAKVLPYYGCGEVQSIGYSCPDANEQIYHTCDEHVVVEVERADGSYSLEGDGAFLLTDLDNRALPLIRYRNGDAGALAAPGCKCLRTLGRIIRLDGRVNDVLLTTAGDAISGVIGTHSFRVVDNVAHFQLVQDRPGQVRIRIVRIPGFDPAVEEPKLRTIFSRHLGATAEIEIQYVDEIAKTAAGKSRLVINAYLEAKQGSATNAL